MATTIVTKKGSGAPAASDLVEGELAVDTTNGRLYTENSSAAVVELGSNPSGNITFGDNGKAIFGAGSDATLHSDGSAGYARGFVLQNTAGNKDVLSFVDGGAATLFHDNAAKIATTATGIDVTGTVTTDGLTSAGDVTITGGSSGSTVLTLTTNALADTPLMVFQRTGGAIAGKLAYEDGNTAMAFGTTTAHELKFLTGNSSRMQIDQNGQLLLGTTLNVFGGADRYGYNFYANGQFNQSIDGTSDAVAQYINRENADGPFTEYYKDRVKVGSIGVANGDLNINGDSGIRFQDTSIMPRRAGSDVDATVDIGLSTHRWKDLYLSGAANVGNWVAFGGAYNYYVHSDNNNYLRFGSGGSEVARFDNSGRLGISNSSPASYTGSASNSLVLGNSSSTTGSHGMTIVAGNQATSSIAFSDHAGDGGTTDYRGLFQYVHADDSLRVFTASGERFRIMSGGDARFTLGADAVGSFQDDVGEVGSGTFCLQVANSAQSALKPLGFRAEDIRFATSGGERMRIASDGVAHFNGDVKVLSGDIQMGSGRGINFSASSNAGGMTSETLSDYEEGTFSATLAGSGSNPTVSYSGNTCRYTKVGNLVTVYIAVATSAFSGGSGDLHINGLPFTADGDSHGGAVSFYRVGSYTEVSPHIGGGTTRVVFLGRNTLTTSGTWNVLPTSAWSGSNPTIAQFSASYRTTS